MHPKAINKGRNKGFILEHRYVAERFMGRALYRDEEVHHLDFNKKHNNPDNLLVLHKSQHRKLHKWIREGCIIKRKSIRKSAFSDKKKVA